MDIIPIKATSMNIRLDGLRIFGYHGVLPQENRVGAMYTINLKLATNFMEASLTDDLSHTINYAAVFQVVKQEMQQPSKLLEHVVYRIGQRILSEYPTVSQVDISLYKENPPMEAECSQVGVEAQYSRQ